MKNRKSIETNAVNTFFVSTVNVQYIMWNTIYFSLFSLFFIWFRFSFFQIIIRIVSWEKERFVLMVLCGHYFSLCEKIWHIIIRWMLICNALIFQKECFFSSFTFLNHWIASLLFFFVRCFFLVWLCDLQICLNR